MVGAFDGDQLVRGHVDAMQEERFLVVDLFGARGDDHVHALDDQAAHGVEVEAHAFEHRACAIDEAAVGDGLYIGMDPQRLPLEAALLGAQRHADGRTDAGLARLLDHRRIVDGGKAAGAGRGLGVQNGAQQVGAVAGRAAAGVVRVLVDDDGTMRGGQRHGDALLRARQRWPERLAVRPDPLRDFIRAALGQRLIARRGADHGRARRGDIRKGKAMEPRTVDHARQRGQLGAYGIDLGGNEAFLRRDDVGQHGQAAHGGYRLEPPADDLEQQRHRLDRAVVKIGMRIQLARQGQIAGLPHGLGHVAMQVIDGGNRDLGAHQPADRQAQIAFDVLDAIGDAGAVQRQQHAVQRQGGVDAVEDSAFHLRIGLGLDRARGRGLADEGADQFGALLSGAFDETADLVIRFVKGLQYLFPAVLLECAQRRLAGDLGGIGIGFMDQAGDSESRRGSFSVCHGVSLAFSD